MRLIIPLIFLFLIGCAAEKVCEAPYIEVGTGCCLDINNNKWCDSDEAVPAEKEKPLGPTKAEIEYFAQAAKTVLQTKMHIEEFNEERKRYVRGQTGWNRFGAQPECAVFLNYTGKLEIPSKPPKELFELSAELKQLRDITTHYFTDYYLFCEAGSKQEEYVYLLSAEKSHVSSFKQLRSVANSLLSKSLSDSDMRSLKSLLVETQNINIQQPEQRYGKPLLR